MGRPREVRPPPLNDVHRCRWARGDALLADYHDYEWGRPIDTDAGHLERMSLEIFQCGLSWRIVLVKRAAFREAFAGYDPPRVAAMTRPELDAILARPDVIRNARKLRAVVENAARFCELAERHGSYLSWFNAQASDGPAARRRLAAALRGQFRFMGPKTTKCYLMGVGKIPIPHDRGCWRRGD